MAAVPRCLPHELLRFVAVGLIAFGLDFGLLWVLHAVVGVPLWLSTGAAFLLSFLVTYLLQRVITFRSKSAHGRALIKYTSLVVFNTLATVLIVNLANTFVDSWAFGKIVATSVTTIWNYFLYRFWIFPPESSEGIGTATD
jgi:putative flippase GtrA